MEVSAVKHIENGWFLKCTHCQTNQSSSFGKRISLHTEGLQISREGNNFYKRYLKKMTNY